MEKTLVITNLEIIEFYQNHPALKIEEINLFFVHILKQIYDSTEEKNKVVEISNLEKVIISSQEHLKQTLQEYKKDASELFKQTLFFHTNDTLSPLLKEIQSQQLDKTNLLLSDLLPKGQAKLQKDVEIQLELFRNSLTMETTKLLSSSLDKKSLDDFFNSLKSSKL